MVYVFKTSVKFKKQVQLLKPALDKALQQAAWNFDLEDCDRIFRVEAARNISDEVISLFTQQGYACEELV